MFCGILLTAGAMLGGMDEEERIVIPAGEYITIEQAARMAGYRGAGNLKSAAASGRLKTIKVAAHLRITTEEWLGAYLASLDTTRGRPRLTPRREQDPD